MLETRYQKYLEQGFVVVTILDSGTAQAWVTKHGLTFPVIEIMSEQAWKYWDPYEGFYPSYKLIKPGMVVHDADAGWIDDSTIPAILP